MDGADAKPQPTPQENLDAAVLKLSDQLEADVFLYSAGITDSFSGKIIELIRGISSKRPNAILILTTNGGSADAAFQIARAIKRHYTKLILYVFGYCKSAGTLIAVAADEIGIM